MKPVGTLTTVDDLLKDIEYRETVDPGGIITSQHTVHADRQMMVDGCFECFPYHGYRMGG